MPKETKNPGRERFQRDILVSWASFILTFYSDLDAQATDKQFEVINRLTDNIINQKKVTYSSIVEEGFLNGYPVVTGIENVPQDTPLIVASNHDRGGILRGMGNIAAVAWTIEGARQKQVRWLEAGKSDKPILSYTNRIINESIAYTFDNISVDRPGQNFYPESGRKILGELLRGGIIGIHPEGQTDYVLKSKVDPRTAQFFGDIQRFAKKHPLCVLPVAGWYSEGRYLVNIGKPLTFNESEPYSDTIMFALGELVPREKQGIWTPNPIRSEFLNL